MEKPSNPSHRTVGQMVHSVPSSTYSFRVFSVLADAAALGNVDKSDCIGTPKKAELSRRRSRVFSLMNIE